MARSACSRSRMSNFTKHNSRSNRVASRRVHGKRPPRLFAKEANLGAATSSNILRTVPCTTPTLSRPDIPDEMSRCPILEKHNKRFEEDFKRRTKIGYIWIDARTHFQVLERLSPDCSPTPDDDPIPKGQATLPLTLTNASSVTPHRSLVLSSPVVYEPRWYYAFWMGTDTRSAEAHIDRAVEIVDGKGPWDTESIAELARHFCWRGAHGMSPEHGAVADFAEIVHVRFGSRWGGWHAEEFMWQLRDITIEAFKLLWLSNPPPFSEHVSYVSAALSLSAFVGDLFARGLIPPSQVHLCLTMLASQAHTIEHVHGAHLLLMHAGKWAWEVQPAPDFVEALGRRVRAAIAVRCGSGGDGNDEASAGAAASCLGVRVRAGEVEGWLDEMQAMVVRWKTPSWAERVTATSLTYGLPCGVGY